MNPANGRAQKSGAETILIVEDDRSLREGLVMNLELRGYKVIEAEDGDAGMTLCFDAKPDLVILDIKLPGYSGLEILAELRAREEDVLVLILSARDSSGDKIEGLHIGADDYVTKPFDLNELLARVEAMLRRQRVRQNKQPKLSFGQLEIDPVTRTVTVGGKPAALSAKEFDLLLLLAQAPGTPFTRQQILDQVWGWGFDGTARTVNNFVLALRQKLERDPAKPDHIKTVRQVGYRFDP